MTTRWSAVGTRSPAGVVKGDFAPEAKRLCVPPHHEVPWRLRGKARHRWDSGARRQRRLLGKRGLHARADDAIMESDRRYFDDMHQEWEDYVELPGGNPPEVPPYSGRSPHL